MLIFVCLPFMLVGGLCLAYCFLKHRQFKRRAPGIEVTATVLKVTVHDDSEGEETPGDRYALVSASFPLPDGYLKKGELFAEDPEQFQKGDTVPCVYLPGSCGGQLYTKEEFQAEPQKVSFLLPFFGLLFFLLIPSCILGIGGYFPFLPSGFWAYFFILTVTVPLTCGGAGIFWNILLFRFRWMRMEKVQGEITGCQTKRIFDAEGRKKIVTVPAITCYHRGKRYELPGSEPERSEEWAKGDQVTLYYDKKEDCVHIKEEGGSHLLIGLAVVVLCGGTAALATAGWLYGFFDV